jgi:hypothetical protein
MASVIVQTERIDIYTSLTGVLVQVDPTLHALMLLHRCSAGKTASSPQVTSRYEPPHRAARTLESPYGRMPQKAGWDSL